MAKTILDAIRARFAAPPPGRCGNCCGTCSPNTCGNCPDCICYKLATDGELRAVIKHQHADLSIAKRATPLLLAVVDAAQKYRSARIIHTVQREDVTAVDVADAAVALDHALDALRAEEPR
jgi:hypothetical protein